MTPTFSVIVATYDRGPLVEATLTSIAQQTLEDFEVLVSSDGPAAAGLADIVDAFDDRFRLVETISRAGSQFSPNNHAWSLAEGRYIAYLGHDDIWLREHLATLSEAFRARPQADFCASGCLYFGPPGSGRESTWVSGLFDPDDRRLPLTHFFPPSSIAHSRVLTEDLRWPDAAQTRRPVDSQFLLEAAQRGCCFTSTRTITVLKFNSALRYLSYLSPDDDEQRAALTLMADADLLRETVEATATEAALAGNYMTTCHLSDRDRLPGDVSRAYARLRGLDTPEVQPLLGSTEVPIGDEPRAMDWHGLERDARHQWRWSGPNPRPRLLLPFTHPGLVRVSLHVTAFATEDVKTSLEVLVDRQPMEFDLTAVEGTAGAVVSFDTVLRQDKPSVVELRMARSVPVAEFAPGARDSRRVGLCLGGVRLDPLGVS